MPDISLIPLGNPLEQSQFIKKPNFTSASDAEIPLESEFNEILDTLFTEEEIFAEVLLQTDELDIEEPNLPDEGAEPAQLSQSKVETTDESPSVAVVPLPTQVDLAPLEDVVGKQVIELAKPTFPARTPNGVLKAHLTETTKTISTSMHEVSSKSPQNQTSPSTATDSVLKNAPEQISIAPGNAPNAQNTKSISPPPMIEDLSRNVEPRAINNGQRKNTATISMPFVHQPVSSTFSSAEAATPATQSSSSEPAQNTQIKPNTPSQDGVLKERPPRLSTTEAAQGTQPKTTINPHPFNILEPSKIVYKGQGNIIPVEGMMAKDQDVFPRNADGILRPTPAAFPVQTTTTATQVNHVETRAVATQIASQFSTQPNKSTVIRLEPEELGRVKMTLRSHETNLVLVIAAERPETADLVRRNIHELAEEFRSLGFENMDFQFDGDAPQPNDHDGNGDASTTDDGDLIPVPTKVNEKHSNTLLDIRL